MSDYLDGLATTLAGAAIPYGFTLVIWATGALVIDTHAKPGIGDVASFAGGACVGYALLRMLARRGRVERAAGIGGRGVVRASLVQACAIGAAITAAGLCARIDGWFAWLLAPLSATLVYLAGTAISEALELDARRLHRGSARG